MDNAKAIGAKIIVNSGGSLLLSRNFLIALGIMLNECTRVKVKWLTFSFRKRKGSNLYMYDTTMTYQTENDNARATYETNYY